MPAEVRQIGLPGFEALSSTALTLSVLALRACAAPISPESASDVGASAISLPLCEIRFIWRVRMNFGALF